MGGHPAPTKTPKVRDSNSALGRYMNIKQLLSMKHYHFEDFDSFEEACDWARSKFRTNAVEHNTLQTKPPKGVVEGGHWRDEECPGDILSCFGTLREQNVGRPSECFVCIAVSFNESRFTQPHQRYYWVDEEDCLERSHLENDLFKKHSDDTAGLLSELGVSTASGSGDGSVAVEHSKLLKQVTALVKSMEQHEKSCRSQIIQLKVAGKPAEAKELATSLGLFGDGLDELRVRQEQNRSLPDNISPEEKLEAVKALQAALTDGQQHVLGLSTKMESYKLGGK